MMYEIRPRGELFPSTMGQCRLWDLTNRNPGEWEDNLNSIVALHGPFEVPILELAVNWVLCKHSALRTVMRTRGERLIQHVRPPRFKTIREVDLRPEHGEGNFAAAEQAVLAAIRVPFYMSHGPLWRFKLYRVAEFERLLVMTAHHIVSDGISMSIVWADIQHAYAQFVERGQLPAPAVEPVSFGRFAQWQGQWTAERRHTDRYRAYWAPTYSTPRPRLVFESARTDADFEGGVMKFRLPAELERRVREVRQAEGATNFEVTLAAYFILIFSLTGEHDISVMCPLSGRTGPHAADVVGRLIATHLIRLRLHSGDTLSETLHTVCYRVRQVLAFQDVPFEWLGTAFGLALNDRNNPLDQVRFSLEDFDAGESRLPHGGATHYEIGGHHGPRRDLSLYMRARGSQWVGTMQYNRRRFQPEDARRIVARYCDVLLAMRDHPDAPVAQWLDDAHAYGSPRFNLATMEVPGALYEKFTLEPYVKRDAA